MNLERLFSEKVCPVCGNQLNFTPWAGDVQSEKSCPCCGIHFGYDDLDVDRRSATYRAFRRRWLSYGKRWWSDPAPTDFDADKQLARLERLAEEPPEWPGAN